MPQAYQILVSMELGVRKNKSEVKVIMAGNDCKGICQRYQAKKRHRLEHRRCSVCQIRIKWYGKSCPCCNSLLPILRNKINEVKTNV